MADQHTHTRIDQGVTRGARNQHNTQPIKAPEDTGVWHVPPGVDPDEVIQRYMSEATTAQIAKSYGCTRKALTRWLRQQRPDAWRAAQALRALCLKEDSEDALMGACDALSLARARELLRAGQWDLERLDADYRPKQEVTTVVQPVLNIQVNVMPATVAIDATPVENVPVQHLPNKP